MFITAIVQAWDDPLKDVIHIFGAMNPKTMLIAMIIDPAA